MAKETTPAQFVQKWTAAQLSERAASQEHFLDLCRLLGQPTPAEHDKTGADYSFEKGVTPTGGASRGAKGEFGFADVWWRGRFAWEYKRKGKYRDLTEAYRQLCQYREALDNPPLLIVSDIARTEIHTNFTGTAKEVHTILLSELAEPRSLDLLRRVFTDPLSFKPKVTAALVTEDIAKRFGDLSKSLRSFGHDPHVAAHFLMKCMFCLFAEDVGLLPKDLFSRIIENDRKDPQRLTARMTELFGLMKTGGDFGVERIKYFNGGLFVDAPALRLTAKDIDILLDAAKRDWSSVEPAIFGTLFERSLDPNTRAQIGAHYTSRDDIMLVVEPVVMAPLRREWEATKEKIGKLIEKRAKDPKAKRLTSIPKRKSKVPLASSRRTGSRSSAGQQIEKALVDYQHRLASVRILDPACGSGNFLYVAIQQLLDLEKEVVTFAARGEIGLGLIPQVRPTQLHGIEINPYAAELAQVVIWIGYLQWMRDNGFVTPSDPVLEPLQTIENRDAILDLSDPKHPQPARWPDADFIIGNPPFLGSKVFRMQGLEDEYIGAMFAAYEIPNTSDLCCYWFERARQEIERNKHVRAGLLATQGIRGGANRTVLIRIKDTGDIFMAWSDREWILDGAAVHVSIIGFGGGDEGTRVVDGVVVPAINSDLSIGASTGDALPLPANASVAFMGVTPSGKFQVPHMQVCDWVRVPNGSGDTNLDVLRPWVNAKALTRRDPGEWIIDFGTEVDERGASAYEAPFEYVARTVAPSRAAYRTGKRGYWCFERPRPTMRRAIGNARQYMATPLVSKHRVFVRLPGETLCANLVIAFARSDDYFFGVLHSAVHELWALRQGTQLEDRPRYTPTSCFETFPLPWSPGKEPLDDTNYKRISEAAQTINEQRERWLNPPEWIEPIERAVDAEDGFADVPEDARALIRHSAIMARAAKDPKLKKRTLTNLYNERPTWLRLAHEQLDRAVLAAYAAVDPQGEWSEDWSRVWIETGAGQPLPDDHELSERRKETDQRVLANLLRMNLERAGK